MKYFSTIAVLLLSALAGFSQGVSGGGGGGVLTTTFTKEFLRATNAEAARAALGVNTNGDVLMTTNVFVNSNSVPSINGFSNAPVTITNSGSGLSILTDSGVVTVSNKFATLAEGGIVSSNQFAQLSAYPLTRSRTRELPRVGYFTFYHHGPFIDETRLLARADELQSRGYFAAGYKHFLIDDGWQIARDGDGQLVACPQRFPNGMSNMVATLRARGFSVGLYMEPSDFTAASGLFTTNQFTSQVGYAVTNNIFVGNWGYFEKDVARFNQWGVDFIKYDMQNRPPVGTFTSRYLVEMFSKVIDEYAPHIHLNSQIKVIAGTNNWEPWVPLYLNSYRQSVDSYVGTTEFDAFCANVDFQTAHPDQVGPGHIADLDALPIGSVAYTNINLARTYFGMAAILASHIQLGSIPPEVWEGWQLATNPLMLAINQDVAVIQGRVVKSEGSGTNLTQVWHKPLGTIKGPNHALAFFNRDTNIAQTISVNWTNLNLAVGSVYTVTNVWAGTNFLATNSFSLSVGTNRTELFIMAPYVPTASYIPIASVATLETNLSDHAQRIADLEETPPGSGLTTNQVKAIAGMGSSFDITHYGAIPNDGIDDTAAIQAAIDAAAGTTNETVANTVYSPEGVYNIDGSLIAADGANAQLVIPEKNPDGGNVYTNASVIRFLGSEATTFWDGTASSGYRPRAGTVWVSSMTNANGNVIASYGLTNSTYSRHSRLTHTYEKMNFQVRPQFAGTVLNLTNIIWTSIQDCSFAQTNASVSCAEPLTNSTAIDMPPVDKANYQILNRLNIVGFETAIKVGEHTMAGFINLVANKRGLYFKASNTGNSFSRVTAQGCAYPVFVSAQSSFYISDLYVERMGTGDWKTTLFDVADSSNQARGFFNIKIKDLISSLFSTRPKIDGGANLAWSNLQQDPLGTQNTTDSSTTYLRGPHHYYVRDSAHSGGYTALKARGTTGTNAVVSVGDSMFFQGGFYDGANYQTPAALIFQTDATISPGSTPGGIAFHTGNSVTARTNRMTIASGGDVTINKSLTVTNTITASNYVGSASGLTGLLFSNFATNGIDTALFTNNVAARIPVATIGGTTYYITLSTNAP